ncbi:MAG: hypothetical protein M3Y59_00630 [Myxococcota bacterium]|nr:hypothetical protein [Myxococcota bacterium]
MTPLAYTTLRVTTFGVVLCGFHWTRFERAGPLAADAFARFSTSATPGNYTLRWDGLTLQTDRFDRSRLEEGMPVRTAPSPLRPGDRLIDKPPPEGTYAAVRSPGFATLLTSPDGAELYEESVSALFGWDGRTLISPPKDRPRVLSTSELAIRGGLEVTEAPIRADSDQPLLLVNAVKGTCAPATPGRAPFPSAVREEINALLERTAFRP